MTTIPTSFNPSDYEFLLKSLLEGNLISKAQALKRFNTLVVTDKKQFSIYAKRVVLAIQDLLFESNEDVNLLASTLALEIINLNPREIQYYIRTKLLKHMVRNLGDGKPQIRKTSHYCLLSFVKTYKTFDEIIQIYMHYGFNTDSWQLRQKSINSFQSILIMEIKYLNWSSIEFKKAVEDLLLHIADQSAYVQKAAEQCLLSICRFEELRNFSKKLSSSTYSGLKQFCEKMHTQGFLQQIKLYIPDLPKNHSMISVQHEQNKILQKAHSLHQIEKAPIHNPIDLNSPQSILPKHQLMTRIQEMRKKAQTPIKQNPEEKKDDESKKMKKIKKGESMSLPKKIQKDMNLPIIKKSINIMADDVKVNVKGQKGDLALGRKLIDDLKNEKDWKVRLEAIEELHNKFINNKDKEELQNLAKTFLPILIKLLADPNFKVALIALKIIEQTLFLESISYNALIPQLVDKISDGKVALRQNISKLIRKEFMRTGNKSWVTQLLSQLKKNPSPNSNIKQQIINILSKVTHQSSQDQQMNKKQITSLQNCLQNIVQSVCPLMDDLKTKIKIKTLDLLILLSIKMQKIEDVKSILAVRLNQVYFEMYTEKIAKEMKALGIVHHLDRGSTSIGRRQRAQRNILQPNRRYNKDNANNTSTSLRKYASVDAHNTTARTASFVDEPKVNQEKQFDEVSLGDSPMRKKKSEVVKSYRKKTFDYKSTQYSAFSNEPALPPFNDPQKELKNLTNEIKSEEWQTCSEALTKLRRIIENHHQLLTHSMIRTLTPEVMRLVESLRSSLSKNAVITLHDLSNKVKKILDTELDSIFSKLLKKTLDANSFISEEVKRALISVCSNCNENRVVGLLFNSHNSRAVPVKISIANVLESIAFLPKVYEKQLDRIVNILVNFMGEGSLQIRQKSKSLLTNILSSEKGSQVIRLVPAQLINKLKLVKQIKKQPTQPSNQQNTENGQNNPQSQQQMLRKRKKQKITVFPEEFQNLESLLEHCESGDWKLRQKNMSLIYQTILNPYPREVSQHRLANRVMDVLSKQIGDPNVKVATNALRILQSLPGCNNQLIEHNLSVLANQIFNCFGSHKNQIKRAAQELFDSISQQIQKWMLIQHMCNGALYGLQKSRPLILQRLAQILPAVYSKGNKKTLINKNVYPMINKIAEENKPENIESLQLLMQICHENTNGEFQSYLKPKAIQIFNSLRID